jgi:1,2-phenylacetyl-CoA epoxidase catalytic subunit
MSLSYVMSAIKISYNPCGHSKTKHIDIWHHFLRDHAIKEDVVISHVGTNDQLADIFAKSLDERRFHEFQSKLNIIDYQNVA